MQATEGIDSKKAAILGISAIGASLVSYFVYRSVANAEFDEKSKKRDRMLRKARQAKTQQQSSKSRIVGANQFLASKELTADQKAQLKLEKMETDLQNAATGTKTIYFDNNDNMYTEEEVHNGNVKFKRNLTKMKVRVPEKDRKRLGDVTSKQTQQCLNDFLMQIKSTKSNYVKERQHPYHTGSQLGGKPRSQRPRLGGLGSEMTTSSGTVSLNRINLQPRHFKSKEGTVWLNMFETISNNYCLGDTSSQGIKNRMDPHRYALPNNNNGKQASSVTRYHQDRRSNLEIVDRQNAGQRISRADRFNQKQQQRSRLTRSNSMEMNMSNFE